MAHSETVQVTYSVVLLFATSNTGQLRASQGYVDLLKIAVMGHRIHCMFVQYWLDIQHWLSVQVHPRLSHSPSQICICAYKDIFMFAFENLKRDGGGEMTTQ